MREQQPKNLVVTSGVSAFTGTPFVTGRIGAESWQWTPAEARQHALQTLEAAEAAEHDAVVVRWLREKLRVEEPERLAAMLLDLRRFRDGA